jgi:hypothetical protein
MPYHIEHDGNKFKVVVDATGKVVGTHPTKIQAQAQLGALYTNVKDVKKCMTCGCDDLGNDHHYISDTEKCISCVEKGQGPCWDGYQYAGTKEDEHGKTVPNCIPVKKSDGGYQPTAGMKSAAAKAIKWKEEGKANGAGTNVGWTRAHQIVNGTSLSLDTVKRMYSFFSRHEVDKQGKEWDKPSHGKVMWYAWGGDAGYSWSRAIVERESNMKKESAGAERLSGGPGFKIEFNVPDCQGGYAVIKAGSGQVIGCYTTKEHAQEAMDAIAVNEPDLTKSDQTKQDIQEGIGALHTWNGSFAPVFGNDMVQPAWMSTYNTPPQKDGTPQVGYGNSSGSKGKSNS